MKECITESDISAMLAPIPSGHPVLGDLREDISASSNYQLLRNARTAARNNERSAQNQGDISSVDVSDWSLILELVPDVLINQSKDIELVAWYIEALTRKFGFIGLARGFSLAGRLIEAYGEQLYPLPDEDGIESQLSSLAGLNGFGSEGALIYPIKAILITQGDVPGPLAVWQCEQLLEADRLTDVEKREAKFKQAGINKAQLDDILRETETPFLLATKDSIALAIEEYKKYQLMLDNYCKNELLPTRQILDTLESCQKVLTYIAGDRLIVKDVEMVDQGAKAMPEGLPKQSNDSSISDREAALQQLHQVATYFRRTEPHSPISYSIEQAIRWSALPLTELIKELIPDDTARTKYQHLSGIDSANKN